jgi:hypothetical protein
MIKVSHRKKATHQPRKTREIPQFFAAGGCFFPVFGSFRLYWPQKRPIRTLERTPHAVRKTPLP